VIVNPIATSATALRDDNGYLDTVQVLCSGQLAPDVTILGGGVAIAPVPSGGAQEYLPIYYSPVGLAAGAAGGMMLVAPALAGGFGGPLYANRTMRDGSIAFNADVFALAYAWNGVGGGWRLANNAPSITGWQRDNGVWAHGDIIYNTDASQLQVLIGSTWKSFTFQSP